MKKLGLPLASLTIVVMLGSGARAADVVDAQTGYALRLPNGWQRVPDEELKRNIAAAVKPGLSAPPKFVAAYEPADHAEYFQYPYAVVQVHSYGPGMSLATISRREVEEMVAKLTGMPASKLKEGISDEMANLVGNASLNSPTVRTTPPGFTMGMTVKVAGVPIRGQSYCVLGRTNAVFLHLYARESDWPHHAGVLQRVASSFRRTPDQAVMLGDVSRTTSGKKVGGGGINWGRVWERGAIGAVIGMVGGLIAWATKQRKKDGGRLK